MGERGEWRLLHNSDAALRYTALHGGIFKDIYLGLAVLLLETISVEADISQQSFALKIPLQSV